MAWVIRQPLKGNSPAKFVLLALADNADPEDFEVVADVKTIAAYVGQKVDDVWTATRWLEREGFLILAAGSSPDAEVIHCFLGEWSSKHERD